MHTGIAHHIDTVIFEIACEQAGIQIVYLYPESITGRLIPLETSGNMSTRKLLNLTISKFNYTKALLKYIENSQKSLPPKITQPVKPIKTSFLFAIYLIGKLSIRAVISQLIKSLFQKTFYKITAKKPNDIFKQFRNDYYLRNIKQIIQQRSALIFMKRNIADQATISRVLTKNTPKLLIAAHFQPEATSFPEGWEFANHIDLVLKLRSLGNKEIILYKEHYASELYSDLITNQLTRVGMSRSENYFKQLQKMDCIFIAKNFNLATTNPFFETFLPVTITGSIAIERSLQGLHTIVAGYPWFKNLPGVLPLSEIQSLKSIKKKWVTPDPLLAEKAFKFIEENFNGKSIINYPGIGTAMPLMHRKDKIIWNKELKALLKKLINKNGEKN